LQKSGSNYLITTFDRQLFTFDSQGRLTQQKDAAGTTVDFIYWSEGDGMGKLRWAQQGSQYLHYTYN
jgi:hypothetical protein